MMIPRSLLRLVALIAPSAAFSPQGAVRQSTCHTPSSLGMATWSDSKAVKDYQDFFSSGAQEIKLKDDCPSVIIVSPKEADLEFTELNPLAQALMQMGNGDDVILSPYQALPETLGGSSDYPIYLTLPPQEIAPFLDSIDKSYEDRNEDFCFFAGGFQYGNIEETLKDRGYCRDKMTQIVISGMEFVGPAGIKDLSVNLGPDSVGEDKIAGECAACGKWNGAIAKRLERNEVRCSTDFYRDWRRKMWERNCLDAVLNLVGSVREEPTTLADVANYYEEEVSDMLWEISGTLRGWKAITLMYGFEERIFGFAEMHKQQCAIIDDWYPYIWGNKVFTESQRFLEYLHYAKSEMGLLQDVELPPMKSELDVSKIRKGNLRADGVV